jgi:hypothetical protein
MVLVMCDGVHMVMEWLSGEGNGDWVSEMDDGHRDWVSEMGDGDRQLVIRTRGTWEGQFLGAASTPPTGVPSSPECTPAAPWLCVQGRGEEGDTATAWDDDVGTTSAGLYACCEGAPQHEWDRARAQLCPALLQGTLWRDGSFLRKAKVWFWICGTF